jgi:hypothetical protein
MGSKTEIHSDKMVGGSDKRSSPEKQGGDQARKTQEWNGGSKASKGPITDQDLRNETSSSKA